MSLQCENCLLRPAVMLDGGSVLVWSCSAASGLGQITIISSARVFFFNNRTLWGPFLFGIRHMTSSSILRYSN
uniref:Uncharacterized protein n=1 Tax=Paramormyrops kingsleyae TaxID=1676925 RepID=A0A3B3T5K8_9TELE